MQHSTSIAEMRAAYHEYRNEFNAVPIRSLLEDFTHGVLNPENQGSIQREEALCRFRCFICASLLLESLDDRDGFPSLQDELFLNLTEAFKDVLGWIDQRQRHDSQRRGGLTSSMQREIEADALTDRIKNDYPRVWLFDH